MSSLLPAFMATGGTATVVYELAACRAAVVIPQDVTIEAKQEDDAVSGVDSTGSVIGRVFTIGAQERIVSIQTQSRSVSVESQTRTVSA